MRKWRHRSAGCAALDDLADVLLAVTIGKPNISFWRLPAPRRRTGGRLDRRRSSPALQVGVGRKRRLLAPPPPQKGRRRCDCGRSIGFLASAGCRRPPRVRGAVSRRVPVGKADVGDRPSRCRGVSRRASWRVCRSMPTSPSGRSTHRPRSTRLARRDAHEDSRPTIGARSGPKGMMVGDDVVAMAQAIWYGVRRQGRARWKIRSVGDDGMSYGAGRHPLRAAKLRTALRMTLRRY